MAVAVAVALHLDAGCAGERDAVVSDPPSLVAEAATELGHSETGLARVFTAYPTQQPAPRMVVDCAEHCIGHAVSELIRLPRQHLFQAVDAADPTVHVDGTRMDPLRKLKRSD